MSVWGAPWWGIGRGGAAAVVVGRQPDSIRKIRKDDNDEDELNASSLSKIHA